MENTTVATAPIEGTEPGMTNAIAIIAAVIPDELPGEATLDFTGLPPVVGTAPVVTEDIAAIIARLDAREAEIIKHSASVLTYERKRPPVSMVGRDSRSGRPMCQGCGYGIRKETRQVEGPRGVYHPNCAKVAAGAADASKISPRYLAAIVPLTQVRIANLAQPALPAPTAAIAPPVEEAAPEGEVLTETEGPQPEVVEDQTTDLVEQATQESGRGKRGRSRRSA